MNKSDTRIKRTKHTVSEPVDSKPDNGSVASYPTPHPCDNTDTPDVPDKPTPNPDRPKRKGSQKDELIYTNGVQKVDNAVSVKVHPDSTNYMRTSKDGLSIKYMINKLECLTKGLGKLCDNLNQLKDEVQPASIIEKIIDNSKEFTYGESGMLEIKLGNGLASDDKGYIGVLLDEDTLAFDENGKIMTIWGEFTQG